MPIKIIITYIFLKISRSFLTDKCIFGVVQKSVDGQSDRQIKIVETVYKSWKSLKEHLCLIINCFYEYGRISVPMVEPCPWPHA